MIEPETDVESFVFICPLLITPVQWVPKLENDMSNPIYSRSWHYSDDMTEEELFAKIRELEVKYDLELIEICDFGSDQPTIVEKS